MLAVNGYGFNPLLRSVFYGSKSAISDWLVDPSGSARKPNENDFLVPELFFAVHDYLHAWAYLAIQSLLPALGFGTTPIRDDNVEDFAFCHLLTEAVATVGLDYWYLATVDLNAVCDIGTRFTGLTVGYREKHTGEYRKFHPRFDAQTPAFFSEMAEFYCSGRFPASTCGPCAGARSSEHG